MGRGGCKCCALVCTPHQPLNTEYEHNDRRHNTQYGHQNPEQAYCQARRHVSTAYHRTNVLRTAKVHANEDQIRPCRRRNRHTSRGSNELRIQLRPILIRQLQTSIQREQFYKYPPFFRLKNSKRGRQRQVTRQELPSFPSYVLHRNNRRHIQDRNKACRILRMSNLCYLCRHARLSNFQPLSLKQQVTSRQEQELLCSRSIQRCFS